MTVRLLLLLSISTVFGSCSPVCDIPLPTTPDGETPVQQSFFDSVDVDLVNSWPATDRDPWIIFEVWLRKDGVLLPHDSTTRLIANGHEFTYDSTGKYRTYFYDLVEEGSYTFTYYHAGDSASFELPIPLFNITSPKPGSLVQFGTNTNTIVTYSPAGGSTIWTYSERGTASVITQGQTDDDGSYMLEPFDAEGSGFFHLIRQYVDSISHPTFNSLKYEYFTRSHNVNVAWRK